MNVPELTQMVQRISTKTSPSEKTTTRDASQSPSFMINTHLHRHSPSLSGDEDDFLISPMQISANEQEAGTVTKETNVTGGNLLMLSTAAVATEVGMNAHPHDAFPTHMVPDNNNPHKIQLPPLIPHGHIVPQQQNVQYFQPHTFSLHNHVAPTQPTQTQSKSSSSKSSSQSEPNVSKRTLQNREAQRNYRKRRDAYVKDLEHRSKILETVEQELYDLKKRHEKLRKRYVKYRSLATELKEKDMERQVLERSLGQQQHQQLQQQSSMSISSQGDIQTRDKRSASISSSPSDGDHVEGFVSSGSEEDVAMTVQRKKPLLPVKKRKASDMMNVDQEYIAA